MRTFIEFITQNFLLFFLGIIAWNIVAFSFLAWRRQKRGLVFPKTTDEDIVFSESKASGSSHKSLITRMAGASRCLIVLVNKSTLAITTPFPFYVFNGMYDLDHIIPLSSIEKIERHKGTTNLEYRREDGSIAKLSLRLRDSERFEESIQTNQLS
jgi:hypothetical protein